MLVLIHFTLGMYLFIRFLNHPWRTQKGPVRQFLTIIIIALINKSSQFHNNNNYWYDWHILKPCQNNRILNMPIKRWTYSHLNCSERTFSQQKSFTSGRNVVFFFPGQGKDKRQATNTVCPMKGRDRYFKAPFHVCLFSLLSNTFRIPVFGCKKNTLVSNLVQTQTLLSKPTF